MVLYSSFARFLTMPSDVDVLKACVHKAIQELRNLKKTKQELESNLRDLNARTDDLKAKRSQDFQRGKEIRREVENWFNDVEKIKVEARENERVLKLLCAPENIARIVVATSSKASSPMESDARNVSIFGVGGVGNTSFRMRDSSISTIIEKAENHHYHYYGKE